VSVVPWREALRVFARIGLQSFGGPAGQIAVMHRILVEEKRWLSEARFLHGLNYCMLLPGPEAMQLVTYVGWLLHRTAGGLAAGILFVLPGFFAVLGLSLLYAGTRDVAFVQGLFLGIKPAVFAIVVEALLRIGRRALRSPLQRWLAVLAFVAIFAFAVPFPLLVLAAGLVGLLARSAAPAEPAAHGDALVDRALDAGALAHTRPGTRRTILTAVLWLGLWLVPVAALRLLAGGSVHTTLAGFFSQVAVVTFGGAYAVLAYVAQHAVHAYGWLSPGEMLDGLGLAETTPGPLILVVQFVGFLAGHGAPGGLSPVLSGVLASLVVVWVTFCPCFLWIFVGAPYLEAVRRNRRLAGALSAITACVVGVIAHLTVWFAMHTLFARVDVVRTLGMDLSLPEPSSLRISSLLLALLALLLLLRLRRGMLTTLAVCAGLGALAALA